ncbi:MAG: hypothetical protein RL412_916 [Pseudomonadota bacterium]|jgi:hypothetical protein
MSETASLDTVSLGARRPFEGREEELGKAIGLAIRTLKDAMPYQHEMNDALVKMHLNSVQFAKNVGLSQQYVEHDVRCMGPALQRIRAAIQANGNDELALSGIFDGSSAFYQLCLDLEESPGMRRFTFPFSTVLAISRKIGQFDMTDAEVHEIWLRPRLLGYARELGVRFEVSDIGADNKVTVRLVK